MSDSTHQDWLFRMKLLILFTISDFNLKVCDFPWGLAFLPSNPHAFDYKSFLSWKSWTFHEHGLSRLQILILFIIVLFFLNPYDFSWALPFLPSNSHAFDYKSFFSWKSRTFHEHWLFRLQILILFFIVLFFLNSWLFMSIAFFAFKSSCFSWEVLFVFLEEKFAINGMMPLSYISLHNRKFYLRGISMRGPPTRPLGGPPY